MPVVEITVDCPVFDSFRVEQVAGMFDVPLAAKATQEFRVGVPEDLLDIEGGKSEDSSGQGAVDRGRWTIQWIPGAKPQAVCGGSV